MLMVLNGLGHAASSLYLCRPVPEVYTIALAGGGGGVAIRLDPPREVKAAQGARPRILSKRTLPRHGAQKSTAFARQSGV